MLEILKAIKTTYLLSIKLGYNHGLCTISSSLHYTINDHEKFKKYLFDDMNTSVRYDCFGNKRPEGDYLWKRNDHNSRIKWLDKHIKLHNDEQL